MTDPGVFAPTGCYKCGRPGHWSRDCPANPGGGGARGGAASVSQPQTGGSSFGNAGRDWGSQKPTDGGAQNSQSGFQKKVVKEIVTKEPRKRPKLTADLLLSEGGLGYLLEKMPDIVAIKGREDSVLDDLRGLLEGYMHWHSLLLPYFSFDQFVEKVEKLGGTRRVRLCSRELRDKIEYGKESGGDKEAELPAEEESLPQQMPSNDEDSFPQQMASNDTSVQAEKEADNWIDHKDVFTNEEPDMPVTNEDFEDFFRQGVESEDTRSSPGLQSGSSIAGIVPNLAGKSGSVERTAAGSIISESARALMETNRLRALDLRARRAGNAGVSASGLQSESPLGGKSPSSVAEADIEPRTPAQGIITESGRALMEANRLKALERAEARRVANIQT